MTARPLNELIEDGWAHALEPVGPQVAQMGEFLRAELAAGHGYLPAGANVLRAFTFPFDQVRVLIVGQDPYPTPGHAVGLSFSVASDVRPLPRSLENIFTEYGKDLGYPAPATGDLTPWAERGVTLLNRVLTVRPGNPASHHARRQRLHVDRIAASLAAVGVARFLRLAPVQSHQRAAGEDGRRPDRLAPALVAMRRRISVSRVGAGRCSGHRGRWCRGRWH